MRDSFERFGGFICLDVMKRGINILLWLYLAVAMNNDLEQICVGCNAIVSAERKEAFDFVVKFIAFPIRFVDTPQSKEVNQVTHHHLY